jgi:EAL domain-containing protein (putative c-di-GMP-specific phosphodiesterase class I)
MMTGQSKTLDTSACKPLFQVKVRLDNQGNSIVVAVEMLTRGTAQILLNGAFHTPFDLPREFSRYIPELDTSNLLNSWTAWVLSQAVLALNRLPNHISLAINLDPREIFAPGFLDLFISQVPSELKKRITIEITEQAPLPTDGDAETKLNELHKQGFKISVDDFCKIPSSDGHKVDMEDRAHSHIYYLATLPVSELKVDMSCTKRISESVGDPVEVLVHWICTLPKFNNKINIVVEGIEKNFPETFLKQYHGNDRVLFQGYAYSKNIELAEVLNLIADPATAI